MKFKTTNRQFLSAALIIFYLIPLLFFSWYSIGLMPLQKSWSLISLGLLFSTAGTLILMLIMYYWEQSIRNKPPVATLIPLQQPFFAPPEKEEKVTLLDPALTFDHPSAAETTGYTGSKEGAKDLNLLQESLKEQSEQIDALTRALEDKELELHKSSEEKQQLLQQVQQVTQDFSDYKLFSEEQLKQKQYQLTNLQQNLEDQRSEMEKRQEQIYQLDTKVHDLSYEIKTLLYLNQEEEAAVKPSIFSASSASVKPGAASKVEESFVPYNYGTFAENVESASTYQETFSEDAYDITENPIRTPAEASQLLKKCINDAQKLTGANYYSNESSRYREFSSSYFAIDQRRLFENLRSEASALMIVYSQKELKVLFVNNQSKHLLGWSPEKFVAEFHSIMQEGMNDWKKALSLLGSSSESQARLLAKTKQGQEVVLNCHLGLIPTGLFRNYVIGVLYPT